MSRDERVGRNEALFREVNERIKELAAVEGDFDFLCECGDERCTVPIAMTVDEYEAVRADPRRFAVVPGHDTADVERVVERNERFAVVEKVLGLPTVIAEVSDPRS